MRLVINGSGQVEPFDESDKPLFMHCAGGMMSVTEKHYKEVVEPLLFDHGVSVIEGPESSHWVAI